MEAGAREGKVDPNMTSNASEAPEISAASPDLASTAC